MWCWYAGNLALSVSSYKSYAVYNKYKTQPSIWCMLPWKWMIAVQLFICGTVSGIHFRFKILVY